MKAAQITLFSLAAAGICCCGSASAQDSPTPLEELQSQYEKHLNLVRRPLSELGEKYEQALDELQQKMQANADLDGLLALKQERERFAKNRSPADDISQVESLARLQKIFAEQHAAERGRLKGEIATSHAAYRRQLERLMVQLTTAGDVDEAVKVRSALEKLGAEPAGELTLKSGLVLHLQFESEKGELVRDVSGEDNHGRLMGDAINHSTGENRRSYAVLDGRGDFIECAHADSLTLTTDGTISLWVRPKRLQSMRGLVSKYNPNKSYTFRTWKDDVLGRIAFGDTSDNFVSKAELQENRWTHLAMTLDDGAVKLYFDGKLDGEGQRSAPLTANTDPVRIGNDYDGRYFTGAIDDVRIYNRALSAKELAEIYRIES